LGVIKSAAHVDEVKCFFVIVTAVATPHAARGLARYGDHCPCAEGLICKAVHYGTDVICDHGDVAKTVWMEVERAIRACGFASDFCYWGTIQEDCIAIFATTPVRALFEESIEHECALAVIE
jgi:hypothetical protein